MATTHSIPGLRHSHYEATSAHARERRTRWVVALTAGMMVAELVVGTWTGSLALTADGWHMATHAGAMGITALAYWFARVRSRDAVFSFGTGKVYALAGYTNALSLAAVALWMLVESVIRLLHPENVKFADALPVAVIGLIVNLLSIKLLEHDHDHDHGHASKKTSSTGSLEATAGSNHAHDHGGHHEHDHGGHHEHARDAHDHGPRDLHARTGGDGHACSHDHPHDAHGHRHGHDHAPSKAHDDRPHEHHGDHDHAHDHAVRSSTSEGAEHDHNLRAAYLHVVSDAMTSVLAILALLAGRYLGWVWLDPLMGVVGAAVILHWSVGLTRSSASQLLDTTPSLQDEAHLRQVLERIEGIRILDLHLWQLGPGQRACIVSIASEVDHDTAQLRARILEEHPIAHLTLEVHRLGDAS